MRMGHPRLAKVWKREASTVALTALLFVTLFFSACPTPLDHSSISAMRGATAALTVSFSVDSSRTVTASSEDFAAAIQALAVAVVDGSGVTVAEATGITYGAGVVKTFGSLPPGTYTIKVNAYGAANALIAVGSSSVTVAPNTNKNVTVDLSYSQGGTTGGLSLQLSWPVSTGLADVTATLDGAAVMVSPVAAGVTDYTATLTAPNLAGGAHQLSMYFRTAAGATPVIGPFIEMVNIWDGVTSTCWIDADGNSVHTRSFGQGEFSPSNADLAALTFTGATLTEAFAAGDTNYTLTDINAATFSFAATSVSGSQKVTYTWNDNPQNWNAVGTTLFNSENLAWVAGDNTLKIVVTAADRQTTKTYTATFTVVTAANLSTEIAGDLDGSFVLTGDLDTTGGGDWTPIGGAVTPFTGTLDGNGHTVKLASSSGAINQGLFGVIGTAGAVKDLTINATLTSFGGESGPLAGRNMGTVENCSAAGTLTTTGGPTNVGGLVGMNVGTIRNSHSSVSVVTIGNWYAGGLAGDNSGTIERCYATGAVTGGYAGGGGLVGHNGGALARISECFSSGHVEGDVSTGAFVGQNENGAAIVNCHSSGSVTAVGANLWYIGGLVGIQGGAATSITNSYASGAVTSAGTSKGGLLGYFGAGTVDGCFYNTDIMTAGVKGTGKTTAELKMQATFAGWDFTTIWVIDGAKNNGYPILRYLRDNTGAYP